jgi:hypothetical protein
MRRLSPPERETRAWRKTIPTPPDRERAALPSLPGVEERELCAEESNQGVKARGGDWTRAENWARYLLEGRCECSTLILMND